MPTDARIDVATTPPNALSLPLCGRSLAFIGPSLASIRPVPSESIISCGAPSLTGHSSFFFFFFSSFYSSECGACFPVLCVTMISPCALFPLTSTLHPPPADLFRCSKLRTPTCVDDGLGYDGPLRETDGGEPLAWLGTAIGFPGNFVCSGWHTYVMVDDCSALIATFNDYVATAVSDKAAEEQADLLAVAIPVGVAIVLAIVCYICYQRAAEARRAETAQRAAGVRRAENASQVFPHLFPVQQLQRTPSYISALPAPTAAPPVARPVVAAPPPTWTPPKPTASTAMSSGAPPTYAAYTGATSSGADNMFNADGTFK